MDQVLLRADFVGVVKVEEVVTPSGENWAADVVGLRVSVEDTWFSRWADDRSLRTMIINIATEQWGRFRRTIPVKERLVVLLSGGPWVESPFTHGVNSVFAIRPDNTLRCISGNPLFAVAAGGFVCSIQPYVATPPISLSQMRADFLTARGRAAVRLEGLERILNTARRPLEAAPTLEGSIDRTLVINEVYR